MSPKVLLRRLPLRWLRSPRPDPCRTPRRNLRTSCSRPFLNILNSGFHPTTSGKVLEGFLQAATAAAGFIIDSVYDRAPRTRRPVFRPSAFGCFWIFWPQIFMFQLLGCCLMVFCGENHMVRESCFWQKKFRTSSGDTLVLNSVCVTTVRATPGGTPIIWKVGHVANHYFSLVCRILLQLFALLAQLPYCLFPLRFFCFFDRRFSRSGFRRFSGVRQRKIPRFHGSKIRPSKILSESIEIWHAGRLWCQASFSWTHSFNLEPFLFYWRLRSANLAIFGSVCENRP